MTAHVPPPARPVNEKFPLEPVRAVICVLPFKTSRIETPLMPLPVLAGPSVTRPLIVKDWD